ncbi:HEAT repeat domain-containing protein [Paludisphaera mucosa]|uniref:HEAT repeat domain-containing protein n=1 Tax=Paludisphaera mucosa TaxID=3030827 RepID=A0ABT6F526_9BACT|nr:HEAT repeat domain-containing protein [Paludisphaera mucosa]MDG3002685.1 HEAT repeat domain-containing protein [Paludisphaera mucosa]
MRFPRLRFAPRRSSAAPASAEVEAAPPACRDRGWTLSLRAMMVLVATCGLVFWSSLAVRDFVNPIQRWSRLVLSGDVEQRREAAAELARPTGPEVPAVVPALIAAVRDADEKVAILAAESLAQAGRTAIRVGDPDSTRQASAGLVAALNDAREVVRMQAALGLAAFDAGSIRGVDAAACTEALAEALGDRSEAVRLSAAKALGGVGTGAVGLRALTAALKVDPSRGVREEAAQSLGRYATGCDEATVALLAGLEDDDLRVRNACQSGLHAIIGDKKPRSAAIVPELTAALGGREPLVRAHAATVLGEIGAEAAASIPALLELLKEGGEPGSMTMTDQFWMHWNPAGRAASALGRIAPSTPRAGEAAAALIAVLRDDPLDYKRARAAEGLAEFGPSFTEPALPILLAALNESIPNPGPDSPAPFYCIALGRIALGGPRAGDAVAALSAALDSQDSETRLEAARALAGFGPASGPALPRLRELVKGEAEGGGVGIAARSAVRRIEAASAGNP